MNLKLSRSLSLPADVAGEAIAILAKRGAGKTNTATVLVEELYAADVQTVVLDPVGVWWGLRSSADGQGEGLKIARIGGAHGDVPLEETAGALIADVAVDSGQSLVVDLSDFPSKASMQRFVTDFAQRLYSRKSRAQSLLHLVLEEADVFAPQSVRGTAALMQSAIEQIVRRGRSRGLGVTLITQRSAVLSKDVLTQTDVLIVMRTTGPHDIRAISEWVNAKGDEHGAEVIASLPSLETGEAWVWNPERDLLKRAMVRERNTFDSSRTPRAGERRTEPRRVAEIDPAVLGKQIADTVERTKANDPRQLRKRISELERQLKERPAEQVIEEKLVETVVEVPVFNGEVDRLEAIAKDLVPVGQQIAAAGEQLLAAAERVAGAVATAKSSGGSSAGRAPAHQAGGAGSKPAPRSMKRREGRAAARRPEPRARPAAQAAPSGDGDFGISGPQQRILNALAALEAIGVPVADKTQLALFAEASPKSSSYTNNLGHLNNQLGLITYPRPGAVALTEAGRELADAADAPTTPEELHGFVYSLVGPAKARILRVLIELGPDTPIEKTELAERADASPTSSSFTNNLGSLRSLGLIDYPDRGFVIAEPVLFMDGGLV